MKVMNVCLVMMMIALAACSEGNRKEVFYGISLHKLVFVCIYSLIISVNP